MSSSEDTNNTCEICGNRAIRKCVVIDNRKVCTDCAKKIIENVEIDDEIKTSTERTLTEVKEKVSGSKGNRSLFIGIVSFFVLMLGVYMLTSYQTDKEYEDRYTQSVDFIKSGNYSDAITKLTNMSYKNSKVLLNYANAQVQRAADFSKAQSYLEKIPTSYSGEFAEDIKGLRESIKEDIQKKKVVEEQGQRDKARSSILVSRVSTDNPNSAGGVNFRVVWQNTSDKVVKYCYFTVVPYNAVGDAVYCTIRRESEYTG